MHPVLITIPGLDFDVQAYGFALGVALVLGSIIALRYALLDRLPVGRLGTSYVLGAVCGVLAARAVFLLQHPDRFETFRSLLQLAPGGMAGLAGAMVGLAATALHARGGKVPVFAWLDCVAPAFAAGLLFERMGAFLAGSAFGRYVAPDFPLAVRYPVGSPAFQFHARTLDALLPNGSTTSLPVHPTQLYAAAGALALVGLAVALRRRRAFSGQVFLAVASAHLLFRTLVEEPLRADASPGTFGPLAPGQAAGVALALGLLLLYDLRRRRAVREPGALQEHLGGPWSAEGPAPSGTDPA